MSQKEGKFRNLNFKVKIKIKYPEKYRGLKNETTNK